MRGTMVPRFFVFTNGYICGDNRRQPADIRQVIRLYVTQQENRDTQMEHSDSRQSIE